jgi:hypothetical protein
MHQLDCVYGSITLESIQMLECSFEDLIFNLNGTSIHYQYTNNYGIKNLCSKKVMIGVQMVCKQPSQVFKVCFFFFQIFLYPQDYYKLGLFSKAST